jgi:adenine-specific DNA-methyltransferase
VAAEELQLSEPTLRWQAATDLTDRKRLGQYMTPRALRERLLDRLELWPGMRVLDPGVGTGEFLRSLLERRPDAEAHGWDVDSTVLGVARAHVPGAHLTLRSALDPHEGEPFDLVLGNPPYFQVPATPELRRRFGSVVSGRPNVFALFFQAGLDVLRPGGRLAYVVPPLMNNGAYFEALREHLVARSAVEHLEIVRGAGHFTGANTAVQLLVLRKGAASDRHVFRREDGAGFRRVIFAEDTDRLRAATEGRPSLWDLGYRAVTGTIVWNQHRERLSAVPGEGTVPLVWSHNIRGGALALDDGHPKPQYVRARPGLRGPAIVVNRVVGAVGAGELRCALVPEGLEFLGENHVNVIVPDTAREQRVGWPELLGLLRRRDTTDRLRLLTGNTQLSARELTHLVPLGP